MRRSLAVTLATTLALSSCGDDGEGMTSAAGGSGGGGGAGAAGGTSAGGGGAGGGAGDGGGGVSPLCDAATLAEPATATTYYVAIDEPGADNDACDGLAPTDEGGGRCPWKDFTSTKVTGALDNVANTRLEVRAGTYAVHGWSGIRVTGTGASDAEPAVLSAYPGEAPVLDVGAPDGVGCDAANPEANPACVREVVRVSGDHTVVQGFTIRNGLAYQLEISAGHDALVRCNRFEETVDFPMRSDQMKLDAISQSIEIRQNEFTQFRSQAIDITEGFDVLVEANEFHHPFDPGAGAVGMKLGSSRIVIRDNDVHDLGDDILGQHAFSLGGTGTPGTEVEYLASDVSLVSNRVWNVPGVFVQLVSCRDCEVSNNDLWDSGGGVLLSADAVGDPQCTALPGGCLPSLAPVVEGNRLRNLLGDGSAGAPEVFVWAQPSAVDGLVAGDNLYCASDVANAQFGFEGVGLDFEAWKTASGTDATSSLVPANDPACAF